MKNYRIVFRNSEFSTVKIVGQKKFTKDLYDSIAAKVDELERKFVASQGTNGVQKFIRLNSNEMSLLRFSSAIEKIGKEIPTVVIKPLGTVPDGLELTVMCNGLLILQFKL